MGSCRCTINAIVNRAERFIILKLPEQVGDKSGAVLPVYAIGVAQRGWARNIAARYAATRKEGDL